jgi:hypothetical protein
MGGSMPVVCVEAPEPGAPTMLVDVCSTWKLFGMRRSNSGRRAAEAGTLIPNKEETRIEL